MVRPWSFVVVCLLAYILAGACSDTVVPGASMVVVEEAAVEIEVVAADGATLEATTGHKLVIPPGALAEDTTIKMTPFRFSGGEALDVLGGAELLPHRLAFSTPATLTVPLAVPGQAGTGYRLLSADDRGQPACETGEIFMTDAGGSTASGDIWDFSCKEIMMNCHSATRDWLFAGWKDVIGYDEASIQERVGLSNLEMTTCAFSEGPLQSLLAAYFQPCGTAEPGEQLDAASLATIRSTLDAGRQVAVLFKTRWYGPPPSLSIAKHSGVVIEQGGELIVLNRLNLEEDKFVELHLQEDRVILELPLMGMIDTGGLRDLLSGEAERLYVDKQGLYPDRNTSSKPKVWAYIEAYCEEERGDLPDEKNLPDPDLRCTGGSGDQDRCDAMCDGGFRGTKVTATRSGDACRFNLEVETDPGRTFMFAFHVEGKWDAWQLNSSDLASGFHTDKPVDKIMALYFEDTCYDVWTQLGCCFFGTCGPSAGCSPDPAEVGLSSQDVPLVDCDP